MKTARTTNKQASQYVNELRAFKANNLEGRDQAMAFQAFGMKPRFYVVYSYGWYPIFVFDRVSRHWYENSDKYSSSTSRHVSQSRPQVNITIKKSLEEMRALLSTAPNAVLENAI